MTSILLVKTSSLGDVIQNLPVVTDIMRYVTAPEIDWVVEEAFAAIPRLHPGVRRVIPVATRRWRKGLASQAVWSDFSAFKRRLQENTYDVVLDTQGLIKSGFITWLARGTHYGYDRQSAWEPLATLSYDRTFAVSPHLHAVIRNRSLAAQAFGYAITDAVDYGIAAPSPLPAWLPSGPYAVLLHATSRNDKAWPVASWVGLGKSLNSRGLQCVFPGGTKAELEAARGLAAAIPNAIAPDVMSLADVAALLAGATVVVGVDTGLTHLAAALGTSVVGLYCATEPSENGVYAADRAINLGGKGKIPRVDEVLLAVTRLAA
jgi:heptosyltransferase I